MNTRLRITLAVIAVCALAAPLAAMAAPTVLTFTGEDFYIPRPVEFAEPGDLEPRLLASYDLAANGHADLIGQICRFTVTAANGSSVHLNNRGLLQTNGSSTDILNTENLPNVDETKLTDATLELGATIQLFNLMVPDPDGKIATSVDYVVTATCDQEPPPSSTTTTLPETTTTTASESTTTTTTPSTTTTEPATSSTTTPTSTSTSAPPATTSTTAPDATTSTTAPTSTTTSTTPATTTTAPGSSTTTEPDTSTSSVPETTTSSQPPTTTETTLPFTGLDDRLITAAKSAAGALLAGFALLAATFASGIADKRGRHTA